MFSPQIFLLIVLSFLTVAEFLGHTPIREDVDDVRADVVAGALARASVAATTWALANPAATGTINMNSVTFLDDGTWVPNIAGTIGTVAGIRVVAVWWKGGRAWPGRISASMHSITYCTQCGVSGNAGVLVAGAGQGATLPAGVPSGVAVFMSTAQ